MERILRVLVVVCAFLVVALVFQAPTVRAVDLDSDGDGLTDGYEDTTLYVQRSAASGLPKGIIDNGAGATSVTILPWQGLVAGGFAEFEVDHSAKSELTVQVGYWDGTKWVDRHVWDPGSRLLGVTITQPAPNAVLQGIVTASATVPAGDVLDKVEFFLGWTLVATVPGPTPTNAISVSVDTIPFPIGNYELKAVMTDKLVASRTSIIPVRIDDTAAPTVSFVMPGSGAYVTGTTTVKVYASDASGVASVDLKVDGGSFFPITSSYSGGYYWYTWTTTSLSNGVHSLTAQAVDRRARVSTSTVSVTVDNAAPSVSITYPSHGSVKSGSVKVTASASDSSGIYAVSFYVDGSWEATDMTSPYEYVWYTHLEVDGSHSVKATATDHAGKSASHTITVITSNGDGEWCDNPPCPMSTDPIASMSLASPSVLSFSTTTESTTSAYSQMGTVSTLVVDLVKPRTQVTQEDRDNRILPAEFDPALLHAHLTWRIVVRDWVYSGGGGGEGCSEYVCPTGTLSAEESVVLTMETTSTSTHGTLRAFAMRLEERSDKASAQTDDDGLGDGAEVLTHTTYPVTPDTDADGARDPIEVSPQTITYPVNGVSRSATVKTSPTNPDTDADGLLDGEEYATGVDRVVTHPALIDTDGDGLTDGPEVSTHHSNATRTDTDGDTISDYWEVQPRTLILDVNGGTQTRSNVRTLPYAEDSDGDGLRDDVEWNRGAPYGVRTDPSDADTDDDGLPDGQEKVVREFSMTTRKTVGTNLWAYLSTSVSGPIERVDVRYGLSSIPVSNFYVELWKGSLYVPLRNRVGSGSYNYSSGDITTTFAHGGTATYRLHVTSSVGGGVLEEFALSFTLRTSPITTDSDGDGLNDSEEVTYGVDGWITDPWKTDTDGDGIEDDLEYAGWSRPDGTIVSNPNGFRTNPLSTDTDQDGAWDHVDLDPLRNLLVAVQVKRVHHGASPWCTPKLAGIVWVNADYAWTTEHRMASEDWYWSGGCLSDIASTGVFGLTYYADVPDDVSSVSVRAAGWSIVEGRWDDPLVDATVGYTIGSGASSCTTDSGISSCTIQNGNSWMTFDLWTHALEKAKTFLVTDGNATVTSAGGQHRLTGQDRYFVFTFDVTSAYGPFVYGVNTIVVPRSIFLDSKLKADFGAGSHWPLADATLYGEDLGKADVSEGVAGVIAKSLSGLNAYNVLERLLRNTANVLAYSYVDVTSYAVLANLPSDVVRILPWAKVVNGATGAPPEGLSDWVVNSLVALGQLAYDGLVALGTFLVNLGEAIWNWGMQAAGQVSQYVAGAVQAAADALGEFVTWLVNWLKERVSAILDTAFGPVLQMADEWIGSLMLAIDAAFMPHSPPLYVTNFEDAYRIFDGVVSSGAFFYFLVAVALALAAVHGFITASAAASAGALGVLTPWITEYVPRFFLIGVLQLWLTSVVIGTAVTSIFYLLFPEESLFWKEGIGLAALGIATATTTFLTRFFLPAPLNALGLKDSLGLIFAISSMVVAARFSGILGAWVGLGLAAIGVLLTLGEDVLDKIPINPIKHVEEIVALISLGFAGIALKNAYGI